MGKETGSGSHGRRDAYWPTGGLVDQEQMIELVK